MGLNVSCVSSILDSEFCTPADWMDGTNSSFPMCDVLLLLSGTCNTHWTCAEHLSFPQTVVQLYLLDYATDTTFPPVLLLTCGMYTILALFSESYMNRPFKCGFAAKGHT